MTTERYNSGTSLDRTNKEFVLDAFEHMVGDFSDELFVGLKRLTIPQLRQLHTAVAERINEIHDKYS